MNYTRKKENFLNILTTRLRSLSSNRKNYSNIQIPILINTINVTQASTQTLSNNFILEDCNSSRHRQHRRRKYQHRFNKCLAELIEKYPPIPAHEYLKDNNDSNCYIWSKLIESREDLTKLNQTLEDLDKRLENLSLNICSKCRESTDI